MMGFFKSHNSKKSIQSINSDDLTNLDPPQLNHLPILKPRNSHDSFISQVNQMNLITETNGETFQSNTKRPQQPSDDFTVNNITLVSNGLKGEQERNLILEQQVKMLSHQAAMALDKLSESNKENEILQKELKELKTKQNKFSIIRRKSSTLSNSTNSTMGNSVFSHSAKTFGGSRSKNSSISSIQTNIDQLKHSNDEFLDQINHNHEKELNILQLEIINLKNELINKDSDIEELKQEQLNLQEIIQSLKKENKSILSKLKFQKQKSCVELEYYQNQLTILNNHISSKKSRTLELSHKLQLYNQTKLGIDNTKMILSL
ncbi:Autophagy-related protein [Wickerhamomyces ciferrii]|uniref:Autophagy-related protein n=1 Tax=Wickerhamomyces ciferrii (strain ATCC 14091 / BCRC 22168 / CBS 111 / JCM 3599 / NBRC 0793 / NRRL Y-1031 F-60-10) TaxID=1206466 RepID=K0KI57_WICCF|nr:Autophagy-related protein [Wickerhamomyces ciferrii]CCH40823.1 Autophagy-related protein [Wickerhamomyces ciferrii]